MGVRQAISKNSIARKLYLPLREWAKQRVDRRSVRLLDQLPIFAPNVAGSYHDRARLALQAAEQTFPLLLDLLTVGDVPLIPTVTAEDFATSRGGWGKAKELQLLFDEFGSDKASVHDYHLVYGSIIADKAKVTALLEVGLGTNNTDVASNMGRRGRPGASVRAFSAYLPHARIFGADIDRRILFREDRIETFFVDQTDSSTVDQLDRVLPAQLDIVIDDGLHSPNANLAILLLAFRKLPVGGWVVIEDIAPQAMAAWQVIGRLMPQNYECHIVRARGGDLFLARKTGA